MDTYLQASFYMDVHWEDFNGIGYLATFRNQGHYIATCARASIENKAWTPGGSNQLGEQLQYLIMRTISETKIYHELFLKPFNHGKTVWRLNMCLSWMSQLALISTAHKRGKQEYMADTWVCAPHVYTVCVRMYVYAHMCMCMHTYMRIHQENRLRTRYGSVHAFNPNIQEAEKVGALWVIAWST